jgi:hypothetical protein
LKIDSPFLLLNQDSTETPQILNKIQFFLSNNQNPRDKDTEKIKKQTLVIARSKENLRITCNNENREI